jgi:hypothetical protein
VFGLASMSDLFYKDTPGGHREQPFNLDHNGIVHLRHSFQVFNIVLTGILQSTDDVHCFLEMCRASEHHIPLVTDTPEFL